MRSSRRSSYLSKGFLRTKALSLVIVAIDGPASSGKSTTARRVARRLDFLYLDTGAMYRAVALAFLRTDTEPDADSAADVLEGLRVDVDYDKDNEMHVQLNEEDVTQALRSEPVSAMASRVSALRVVREKLVAEQRRIARAQLRDDKVEGIILDGRDIGTVVFPEADVKIFMVAEAEVRARRRHAELQERGEPVEYEDVLADIRRRDRTDRERTLAPLRRAEDAIELDTTHRSVEEQVQFVVDRVRERRKHT